MTAINPDKLNIDNLTSLWKAMGIQQTLSQPSKSLFTSQHWPNRCWLDWEMRNEQIDALDTIIDRLPAETIIPLWDDNTEYMADVKHYLQHKGFSLYLEQTAMYMTLRDVDQDSSPDNSACHPTNTENIIIEPAADLALWTHVAAQSFGYAIDQSAIEKIAKHPDAQLLILQVQGKPAATALLFQTNQTLGIHQVGVSEAFRNRGIARTLMQHILQSGYGKPCKYITLQASAAGEKLYQQLGFTRQFGLSSFRRTYPAVNA